MEHFVKLKLLILRRIQSSWLLKILDSFLLWKKCSIEHCFNFSLKATLQIMQEDCLNKYTPLFIAKYSVIQLSELEQQRRVRKDVTQQHCIPTLSHSRESEAVSGSTTATVALAMATRQCKVKVSSYIAQYPVLRTVQCALHFTSLFTQTPFRLL